MLEKRAKEYAVSRTYPRFENNFTADFVLREVEGAFWNGAKEALRWHSIRDKLPEKEKYVLIYTNVDNVYMARLVEEDYFITKKGGFVQTSAVVAWKETDFPEGD